jgi:hypothetical protein
MNTQYIPIFIGVIALLFIVVLGARYLDIDNKEQTQANPSNELRQPMGDNTTLKRSINNESQPAQGTPATSSSVSVAAGGSTNEPF